MHARKCMFAYMHAHRLARAITYLAPLSAFHTNPLVLLHGPPTPDPSPPSPAPVPPPLLRTAAAAAGTLICRPARQKAAESALPQKNCAHLLPPTPRFYQRHLTSSILAQGTCRLVRALRRLQGKEQPSAVHPQPDPEAPPNPHLRPFLSPHRLCSNRSMRWFSRTVALSLSPSMSFALRDPCPFRSISVPASAQSPKRYTKARRKVVSAGPPIATAELGSARDPNFEQVSGRWPRTACSRSTGLGKLSRSACSRLQPVSWPWQVPNLELEL